MSETKKVKPVIYISGPITGIEENNFRLFALAEERLNALGYETRSPHVICADLIASDFDDADKYWQACMRLCLAELLECTAVMTLDGWEASRGAKIEVAVARDLDIQVIHHVAFFDKYANPAID